MPQAGAMSTHLEPCGVIFWNLASIFRDNHTKDSLFWIVIVCEKQKVSPLLPATYIIVLRNETDCSLLPVQWSLTFIFV